MVLSRGSGESRRTRVPNKPVAWLTPVRSFPWPGIRITIVFMERKIQGHNVSEEQIAQWVDEAETGYDPEWLGKRLGRPARAEHAAKVVPVRLTDAELGAVMARAEREHLNRSEAIRQALAQWAAAS